MRFFDLICGEKEAGRKWSGGSYLAPNGVKDHCLLLGPGPEPAGEHGPDLPKPHQDDMTTTGAFISEGHPDLKDRTVFAAERQDCICNGEMTSHIPTSPLGSTVGVCSPSISTKCYYLFSPSSSYNKEKILLTEQLSD